MPKDLLFPWGMPPKTLNPNATEHERKEKKKFNFFSENWGITSSPAEAGFHSTVQPGGKVDGQVKIMPQARLSILILS
jgi:hypothetical protein